MISHTTNHSFCNNLGEHDPADKLRKIRPWLFKFCENCLKTVPDENNSVDEMIVPWKGKFSGIKQYNAESQIRGTWARTTTSGLLCDFGYIKVKVMVDQKKTTNLVLLQM